MIDARLRAVLVTAALASALALAACGKRTEGDKTSGVPSDLDSMMFKPESAQVRADVDSGNAQFLRAWKTGSGDLMANAFTEDGTLLVEGGPAIQGRDSITAVMGRLFSQRRMVNGTITTQSLRIDGDQAIERGRYVFGIAPVRGGRPVIRSGEYETVWKYESGQWKRWRGIGVPQG